MPAPVDTEALVAAHLRSVDLEFYGGRLPDGSIPDDRRPDADPFEVGRVSAAPGGIAVTSKPMWVTRSLLYCDAWALTRDAAFDFAGEAIAAMEDMEGEHDLGVVTACTFTLTPSWEPDSSIGDPAVPHWRWAAYVTAHPLP